MTTRVCERYRAMTNGELDDFIASFRGVPAAPRTLPNEGCCGCGGANVQLYMGRFVCNDCEALNGSYIDSLPEWRSMPADGSKQTERCGVVGSDLYTASNMGCTMTATTGEQRRSVRLQSWSSMAPRDRALYAKITGMNQKTARGKIPVAVMHLAQRFYKAVNDMPAAKGTRRAGLCEGAVYTAFRACGVSRSTREIATIFDTPVDVVEKGCKRVAMYIETPQQSCRPQHFAMRFATNLFTDEAEVSYILPLMDAIEELGVLVESKPPTVAACCLALLGDRFGVPRKLVSTECNVAEATISKCVRKLRPYVDDLLEVSGVPFESHPTA
jgi:transcription initiation factor TFIIIB Brf1 subunit/transcription initiation factor TFIIB